MRGRRFRENGLLMTVLLVGLGIVVVGAALAYLLRIPIENSIREEAVYDIVTVTQPLVVNLVSPEELAQPMLGADYDNFDRLLRAQHVLGPHVTRLKLWSTDGTVIYSTKREQVGETHPGGGNFAKAVTGNQAWELTDSTESRLDRELGEVLEVYVPLTWREGGKPAGVLEVYLPYAHYRGLLTKIRNSIFLAVALASVTVPSALYVVYRKGYKRIRAERDWALQREREVNALNRILQAGAAHNYAISDRLAALKKELDRGDIATSDSAALAGWLGRIGVQVGELAALCGDPLRTSHKVEPGQNGGDST